MFGKRLGGLLASLTFAWFAAGLCGAAWAAETAAPPAHIQTVFVILMENHNWTGDRARLNIKGNPAAPYINHTLLPMASHAERYFNPPGLHPSLPNYLWLEAGSNLGVTNDRRPSFNSQSTHAHLVALLDAAGIGWKAYLENTQGRFCPLNDAGHVDEDGSRLFAVRHEPFAYFDDVTGHLDKASAYCIAHLRPFSELKADLASDTVPRYVWITPNECADMHDGCKGDAIAHGDAWLSRNVPAILHSAAYRKGGALFILWDEADNGDGPIGLIALSPFAKGGGYSNRIHYTHGSALRTIEEIFAVEPLLRDAAVQTDLFDLFRVFP
ncbi:MAG: phosphoesterase [Caulobacteraceae bacterium]|nr:phosphoesterase [Caulobacteraceae bacterium]